MRYCVVSALITAAIISAVGKIWAANPQASARDYATRIDAYILQMMAAGRIPGLALAIVEGYETTYQRGYGVADRKGTAVTPQTPFSLCSVGKAITALAIRQLVNEGKIRYDMRVQECLPWFSLADTDAATKITISHLINHCSGLSTESGRALYAYNPKYSIEQLIRKTAQVQPIKPAGETYEYSNLNYVILGHIIEQVSGMTYEQYLQQNIFDKLEMKNSFLSREAAKKAGLTEGHSFLFGIPVALEIPLPTAMAPAGFQMTSAEDMARFVSLYLNNGYYKGISIIPNNDLPERKPPAETFAENEEGYDTYWMKFNKPRKHSHNGGDWTFSTVMRINPLLLRGVIVLANLNDESAIAAEKIADGVIAIIEGKQPAQSSIDLTVHRVRALAALVIVALLAFRALRARRFVKRISEGSVWPALAWGSFALLDVLLPLLILLGIPLTLDITWEFYLNSSPEIAGIYLVSALLLAATGAAKIILLMKGRRAGGAASV